MHGCYYAVGFLLLQDDRGNCQRWLDVYYMRTKDQVLEKLRQYAASNRHTRLSFILQSDNGGEYVNKKMSEFALERNMKQEFSGAYTPEQNQTIERIWRTLGGMTKAHAP